MRFLINFFQSSLDILSTIFAFRNNNEQTDQFFVRKTANLGLNRLTTKNTHHSSRRFLGNQLFSLMVAPFSSLSGNWRALATCSGPFRCSCCCWPLLAAGCSCQLATSASSALVALAISCSLLLLSTAADGCLLLMPPLWRWRMPPPPPLLLLPLRLRTPWGPLGCCSPAWWDKPNNFMLNYVQ